MTGWRSDDGDPVPPWSPPGTDSRPPGVPDGDFPFQYPARPSSRRNSHGPGSFGRTKIVLRRTLLALTNTKFLTGSLAGTTIIFYFLISKRIGKMPIVDDGAP